MGGSRSAVREVRHARRASGTAAGTAGTRTGCGRRAPGSGPGCRRRSRARRRGGRRTPGCRGCPPPAAAPRVRRRAGAGRCRCGRGATPSAISTTRSFHICSNVPAPQRAPRPQRVDAVPEQHLGAVDVADAGQHRLVHQQRRRRAPGCGRPAPRPGSSPRRRAAGRAPAARPARAAARRSSARRRWRRAGRRTPAGDRPRCPPSAGAGPGRRPAARRPRSRRTSRRGRGARAPAGRCSKSTNRCLP